jgi:hypothetical protein
MNTYIPRRGGLTLSPPGQDRGLAHGGRRVRK